MILCCVAPSDPVSTSGKVLERGNLMLWEFLVSYGVFDVGNQLEFVL